MSEGKPLAAPGGAPTERAKLGLGLTVAVLCAVVVGALAVLYVISASIFKPGSSTGSVQQLAQGPMSKLQAAPEGVSYPATQFLDGQGQAIRLSAFKGKAVVLNLWATWCAPCVKEMPTLAALQTAYAGKPLQVVAVSMDQAAQTDAAKAFMARHAPLGFYQDARYGFLSDLKPHLQGFPTTVLFDRNGVERYVLMGEPCPEGGPPGCAGWASPEAHKVIDKLLTF